MFTKAVEWSMAHNNPTIGVRKLRESNGRIRYLTNDEAQRLVTQCAILEGEELRHGRRSCIKGIVVTALNTGMRKGEILGLKWSDIDFRQGIILLENPKNGQRREVPLNGMLTRTLKTVKSRFEEGGQYVFCDLDGKPFNNVRRSFNTALRRAGITDFRFHDLRHTFASHLVMAGVDLVTVKELLGHKSLDMTMRYSHLSPDHKRKAVSVLDIEMDTNMDTEDSLAIISYVSN